MSVEREPDVAPAGDDLLYVAWTIIANASYWDHTDETRSAEWLAARDRWRDRWHNSLAQPPTEDEHIRDVLAAAVALCEPYSGVRALDELRAAVGAWQEATS